MASKFSPSPSFAKANLARPLTVFKVNAGSPTRVRVRKTFITPGSLEFAISKIASGKPHSIFRARHGKYGLHTCLLSEGTTVLPSFADHQSSHAEYDDWIDPLVLRGASGARFPI